MPNKHFCQGPDCHTRTTQDRFLKSRGVIRGRYASIEQGRPIEFIRHRRESGGYHKVTENNGHWGPSSSIQRVDNRTELE